MRITYLIGAGASAGAIPVVEKLKDDFKSFHSELKNSLKPEDLKSIPVDIILTKPPEEVIREILDDVQWLINESENYSTIDTLAKKLYLSDKDESKDYKKLKNILTIYFNFRQFKKPLDPRYDNFFATILRKKNGKIELPKNICIISWNYDVQFELSLSKFLQKSISDLVKDDIQFILPNTEFNNLDPSKFTLIKLNGSAIYKDKNKQMKFLSEMLKSDEFENSYKNQNIMLDYALLQSSNHENFLSFAWEDKEYLPDLTNWIRSVIQKSDTLSVIGYSFPNFNRDIDYQLLNNTFNIGGEIVIQNPLGESLKEKVSKIILKLPSQSISTDEDLKNFHIPADFIFNYD